MVYVNIENKNEVVAIDSHALTIKARWPVAPAGGLTAIAMDREHRRLSAGHRLGALSGVEKNLNIVERGDAQST
jgi:hypothetical protein